MKIKNGSSLAFAKTNAQISCAVTAQLITAFVFASRQEQFLSFLNPTFQASSFLLRFYSSVWCHMWSETLKTDRIAAHVWNLIAIVIIKLMKSFHAAAHYYGVASILICSLEKK